MESLTPFQNIKVNSNFFRIKVGQIVSRYKIDIFEDDQPIDLNVNQDLMIRVISIHRKELHSSFGITHYRIGNIIYSPKIVDETSFLDTIDSKTFKTMIKSVGVLEIEDSPEACGFYGRILKSLQDRLKLKQINRKYYKDDAAVILRYKNSKIEIWPRFSTSLRVYNTAPLIKVDMSYKVLIEKTVADILHENKGRLMYNKEKLNNLVRGIKAVAIHNKISFRIEGFDFEKKLTDTFTRADGTQISFLEYFKERYNKDIREKDMPLVVFLSKRNGRTEIRYMPPELCVSTSLSEEMKEDRTLMREVTEVTKPKPEKRLENSAEIITMIQKNEDTNFILKDWDIGLDSQPLEIPSKKADAGKMLLGTESKEKINLENNSSLDRDSQAGMYEKVELNDWVVMYLQREEKVVERFLDVMKQSADHYKYSANKPRLVGISGKEAADWIDEIKKTTDQNTTLVVLILEGRKNAGPLYNDLKRFFTVERPIPNQVVLTSTANSDRRLRSICNKILVQMCAKLGGIPWNVNELPFSNQLTMVVGIDVFHKANDRKRSIMAFTATVNEGFSRYWSTVRIHEEGQEIGTHLESAFKEALEEFKQVNNSYPIRVIIYRDGVSENQRQSVFALEISSIVRGVNALAEERVLKEKPEIIFICANKRVNAKFFNSEHLSDPKISHKNPSPGTIVDTVVTGGSDFYLISQTTREGIVTPTHYFVLAFYKNVDGDYRHRQEEVAKNMQDIQLLTYKLCYLYYNWVGSVKVPAPIRYAARLARLIGERLNGDKPIVPHLRFGLNKCLYFI